MPTPTVSIIIPTRDRWTWLREALHSVALQRGVSTEVIVVDDGSSAPAPGDLLDIGLPMHMLRLDVNHGVAAARNRGASTATGEWIAFLDDDDYWAPQHLSSLVRCCRQRSADFGYSASWVVDEFRRVLWHRPAPAPDHLARQLRPRNAVGTPSGVIVRRSFFEGSGGFDEELAAMADWDLWLRWARIGRAATTGEATLAYTEHMMNMSLGMRPLLEEFETLRRRYHESTSPLGGAGFARWIARSYRRMGMRPQASAWYFRSAVRGGQPSDALRAAAILFGEHAMRLRLAKQTPPPPQPAWLPTRSQAAAAVHGESLATRRKAQLRTTQDGR